MSVETYDHDLDDLLDGLPPGSPLHDLLLDELEADPLPVDDDAAQRVATASLARLQPERPVVGWTLLTGLAVAATLLLVLAGSLTDPPPSGLAGLDEVGLRAEAVQLHQQGRTDDDPALLQAADRAYEEWFEAFEGTERDPTMRYAWGELKYALGDFDAAYALYTEVATEHPDHDRAVFCAKAAVYAADELLDADAPDTVDRYVAAADLFAELAPDDDDDHLRKVRYAAAYHLMDAGRGDEAAERFEQIIATWPDTPEAAMALNLRLDLLVDDLPALADRLTEALIDTPEAVDDTARMLVDPLLQTLDPTDPERAQALRNALP
jgi:tetratricopeptide (TPR) repeat protein